MKNFRDTANLKVATLMVLCIATSFVANAQFCNGNLGDNIFPEGDFGSGTAPVLLTNPNIAPGYAYNTNAPIEDGEYVVVNTITAISNDWLPIGDNSSDPNGYMMMVNASFDPGLFYEQTVDGLCENTTYVFSADVINLINDDNFIKPNVSFLIDGVIQYGSGDVPPNSQWMSYGFTFTTNPGQTTITLGLQNNAPGGQGNDLAIDNISFRPCGPEAVISPNFIPVLCEDGTSIELEAILTGGNYATPFVQWQVSDDGGQTWSDITGANAMTYTHTNLSGGTYIYRFLLANGSQSINSPYCRVVSDERIVEVIPKFYYFSDTICEGLTAQFGGQEFSVAGSYTDSLVSQNGCDSIVIYQLVVVPDELTADFEVTDPNCFGVRDGTIEFLSAQDGTAPFQFTINGGQPQSDGMFSNLAATEYLIETTDRYGCSFETSFTLENPVQFEVDIEPDYQIELGEMIEVFTTSNQQIASYNWNPNTDCQFNCDVLEWFPTNTGYLVLDAISDNGCEASDSVFVEVEVVRNLYFPNAFTPNGDGLNDRFHPIGQFPNAEKVEVLQIFNRWGQTIYNQAFSMNDAEQKGWDGTQLGKAVEAGVYAYFTKVQFLDGKVFDYSGTVTLMR